MQQNWYKLDSPTNKFLTKIYFVDNLNGFISGDSGIILKTTNAGISWNILNTGIENNIENIFFINKNLGFALAWKIDSQPYKTIILKTIDGGNVWEKKEYNEENIFFQSIHFFDSLNGFLGGFGGVIAKTIDGGRNWRNTQVLGNCSALPISNFSFLNRDIAFATGGVFDFAGVIWNTKNSNGEEWNSFCLAPEPIEKICFIDSLNIIGVGGDFEYGASVIRSTNGGDDWNYSSLNIFGIPYSLSMRTQNEFWSPLGFANEFLYSTNSGIDWNVISTPDSTSIFDVFFVDSLCGYAVGYNGIILKYTKNPLNIKEEKFPNSIYLNNYPNPFNNATKVFYNLTHNSFVNLDIFDLNGNLIKTLVNKYQSEGSYNLTFDSENFSSGIYFCNLKIKSNNSIITKTQKMILLK